MVRINDRWIENTECDRKWVVADNGGNEARRKEKKREVLVGGGRGGCHPVKSRGTTSREERNEPA